MQKPVEKSDKTGVRCRNEQRLNIKFCVKLGKTPSETYCMLKSVYGDSCMSKVSAVEWHRKFRKGREDVADSPRTGRPSTQSEENIKKVHDMLLMDQTLSNQQIAKQLNVSRETIRRIRSYHLKIKTKKPKKTLVKEDTRVISLENTQKIDVKHEIPPVTINTLMVSNPEKNEINMYIDHAW